MTAFVRTVLAETEDTWKGIFQAQGETYEEPTLVLFSDGTQSACGFASSATARSIARATTRSISTRPSSRSLPQRFGASGRFRRGLCHRPRGRPSRAEPARHPAEVQRSAPAHERSRRQQDVDARRAAGRLLRRHLGQIYRSRKALLEQGDLEEALNAAQQIGDDTLQKRTRAMSFRKASTTAPRRSASHGSSAASTAASCRPAIRSPGRFEARRIGASHRLARSSRRRRSPFLFSRCPYAVNLRSRITPTRSRVLRNGTFDGGEILGRQVDGA